VEGTVIELTVNNGPAAAADALRRIDAAGITLAGLQLREPSLDDVFLNLTGHKAEDATDSAPLPERRRGRRKASI
jgi:ABC-2 type transport system ATP-binding protein